MTKYSVIRVSRVSEKKKNTNRRYAESVVNKRDAISLARKTERLPESLINTGH